MSCTALQKMRLELSFVQDFAFKPMKSRLSPVVCGVQVDLTWQSHSAEVSVATGVD